MGWSGSTAIRGCSVAEKSLTFNVFGKDVSASKTIRGVGNEAQSMGKAFGKTTSLIGKGIGLLGVAVAGSQVVDFLHDSVDAYRDAGVQQAKLEDAYKRFPKVSDVAIDSLREYNHQLSYKVGYDDDAIASSQAVIAQFDLTGKQIKDLTPLIVDYAAKTGQDLPTAAEAVGKALLGNTKALKSLGINGFKPTGDRAADATTLIGLLQDKVGGFAEQAATTDAGKLQVLQTKFGDLQETVGSAVVPAFSGFVDFVNNDVMTALDKFSQKLDETHGDVIKSLGWGETGTEDGPLSTGGWTNGFDQMMQKADDFTIWWAQETFKLSPPWLQVTNMLNGQWLASVTKMQTDAQVGIGTMVVNMGTEVGKLPGKFAHGWQQIEDGWNGLMGSFEHGWQQIQDFFSGHPVHAQIIYSNVIPPAPSGGAGGGRVVMPFASGGIVKARPGGLNALIAEAGVDEAVIPLTDQNLSKIGSAGAPQGGGGPLIGELHVHVEGAVLDSPAKLGSAVVKAIGEAAQQGAISRSKWGFAAS